MSPAQIVRYCRNRNLIRTSEHKHDVEIAWLTAVLQRAKKVPSLKKLTTPKNDGSNRPTLADIIPRLMQPPKKA